MEVCMKILPICLLLAGAAGCYRSNLVGRDAADQGCGPGLTPCDGECVNLDSDSTNCGMCGYLCEPDETCSRGICRARCVDECDHALGRRCSPDRAGIELCGDYDFDGCLEWSDPVHCPSGTACVDGSCLGSEFFCGDGICDPAETCLACPDDCGPCPPLCGDGVCDEGEGCASCPGDCGSCPPDCGNDRCDESENCETCPQDCGECIEGCEPLLWDLSADFSATDNPNGLWTYGWTESDGSGFALATPWTDGWGIDHWGGWRASDGNPNMYHNGTSEPIETYGFTHFPGETIFHPGPNDERFVVRWTAPGAGSYRVEAEFNSKHSGATDVSVLWNGTLLHDAGLDGSESSYQGALTLAADDRIDFTVGYGPDHNFCCDSTGIRVTIRRTDWDLARDFSSECNPTGAWTYGSTDTLGSFDAFQFVVVDPDVGAGIWTHTPVFPVDGYAHTWKNTTDGTYYGVLPGQTTLHPGCYGFTEPCCSEWAVARWTSSFAGEVTMNGFFGEGDSATPDLDIARTSSGLTTVLWHRENTALTEPFDLTTSVEAGDFIDFVVGDAYCCGNTPLMVTITRLDTGD
jgi:hypothetical protein